MIVLVAGPIAVGKTTIATALATEDRGELVRVRHALAEVLGVGFKDRTALQREGAKLDQRTNGRWLRDYLIEKQEAHQHLVVDSLRTHRQTVPILEHFADARLVYLDAHESTRRARYQASAAADPLKATTSFDVAMNHPTETGVSTLQSSAHLHIETDDLSIDATIREVLDALNDTPSP